MTPADIIAQLESTSGRLDKEQIIQNAWDAGCLEFFEGVKMAYNPLITFGVKKVPLIEGGDDPAFTSNMTWDKFKSIAAKLQHRELTGNAARDVLRASADSSSVKDWNGWYRRILLKDLKAGVSETTINKILEKNGTQAKPYIVPIFSCQLAKNGEDHPKKMVGMKLIDIKLDGCRILTILDIENNTVTQYTRDGRQNDRFETIATSLAKLLPKLKQSIVFDGEMVSRSFQTLMKQINRKDDVDTSDAKLALFDIIPLKDFIEGEYKLSQVKRHEVLTGFIPLLAEHCGDRVYVIPKMAVNLDTPEGQQKFKEFNNATIAAGLEGVMLKNPDAPYKTKRTDAWLKVKPWITVDLEVVGFESGKNGSKFENTLGGLVCRGLDQGKHIEVTVGGGYSEELRDEIWNNQDKVLGRMVEIKGDVLTQSQDSDTWSLRFPVFMGFRDDKHTQI